jgi:hypothetical protein
MEVDYFELLDQSDSLDGLRVYPSRWAVAALSACSYPWRVEGRTLNPRSSQAHRRSWLLFKVGQLSLWAAPGSVADLVRQASGAEPTPFLAAYHGARAAAVLTSVPDPNYVSTRSLNEQMRSVTIGGGRDLCVAQVGTRDVRVAAAAITAGAQLFSVSADRVIYLQLPQSLPVEVLQAVSLANPVLPSDLFGWAFAGASQMAYVAAAVRLAEDSRSGLHATVFEGRDHGTGAVATHADMVEFHQEINEIVS